jgi:hypothetical protein
MSALKTALCFENQSRRLTKREWNDKDVAPCHPDGRRMDRQNRGMRSRAYGCWFVRSSIATKTSRRSPARPSKYELEDQSMSCAMIPVRQETMQFCYLIIY